MNQKGVAHILLIIILVIGLPVLVYLVGKKTNFLPKAFFQKLGKATPIIDLKTEYSNPFKKETQYVNPFETYKNPFTLAK